MGRLIENGCVRINTLTAVITCIILIISFTISIVFATTTLQNQVDDNTNNINEIKSMLKDNIASQEGFRERMAIVETQYDNIKTQLDRIENKVSK